MEDPTLVLTLSLAGELFLGRGGGSSVSKEGCSSLSLAVCLVFLALLFLVLLDLGNAIEDVLDGTCSLELISTVASEVKSNVFVGGVVRSGVTPVDYFSTLDIAAKLVC